jgi:hypothetical protein
MGFRLAVWGIVAVLALIRPAQAATQVDLTLVLAVDVSLSMAEDEAKFQRHGYIEALRDKRVLEAIQSGKLGKHRRHLYRMVGVTDQRVLVGWQVISDEASAEAFAAALDKAPFKSGTTTSISAGIDFSVRKSQNGPYVGTRKVIDVSGDGYSDYGRPIRVARRRGGRRFHINGLPVMNPRPPGASPRRPISTNIMPTTSSAARAVSIWWSRTSTISTRRSAQDDPGNRRAGGHKPKQGIIRRLRTAPRPPGPRRRSVPSSSAPCRECRSASPMRRAGAAAGQRDQRRIVEDDVGRHALFARQPATFGAQRLEDAGGGRRQLAQSGCAGF